MKELLSRFLPYVVAAATLGCHCHCVATAADVIATGLVPVGANVDPGHTPVDPGSQPDHDESGCICRGAVFVPSIEATETQSRHLPVLAAPISTSLIVDIAELAASLASPLSPADEPPRVSGRMLRALLSSLVI